ncbi:CDK5 regulatory subunit-associated protein 2 isoform X1 [Syngnathoides biaculeatus]|uniref:CDK5 regulatory subunit-associated protein 2 isoform X1 n=1 Tax=Syngnathoides biaculeatus TaxID=300417 RepID=UPI002ADD8926|nr:CDK5 regulatory subunit-associated protein 2 isoform X1 [Syngnathoides biaculeatus]XP_061703680.1 CDK5 regulatory subunit-associated protein 2 isoform X1 [Syngnathoides biaculeatus]
MDKQTELVQLQGEHHAKVLEAQKLQRAVDRREQELADLQRAKEQLEVELEDLQQQKKKGDKALNDLNNQLKKLSSEIGERESSLEEHYQELLHQTQRKVQAHEVTIQRLTSTLADKEQQLLEYINMVREFEEKKSPPGNDGMLAKLRQRLKEKEKALEQALDERFVAIEEKDNEIHQLQLSLREKERDLERLNNLLSHNEETINSFDSLIKEKDVELQHLANTLKNLQRAKQDVEDNLNRTLREKDAIIGQLQLSLDGKTKELEEMSESAPSKSQSSDLAEQMGQKLKLKEAMLAEALNARERLVADNEGAVEGLLATINSKDQLIKESAEHYNRMLSERSQEIQELRRQLSERQQQLTAAERQSSTAVQKDSLETAKLRQLVAEKDSIIDRLLQRGQETYDKEPDYVLDLRQTIQIMQEKLDGQEAERSRRNSDESVESIPVSKKTVVVLKKELAQKTEALNKALKRENQLKMSLAELQSLLSELEGRSEGQAANIESLVATLETKDEIIHDLQRRLCQPGDTQGDPAQDQVVGSSMDRLPSGLPQRETTMIGGDSQQEGGDFQALPSLVALQQEHKALNKALRAEQQLYSSLVRTVKEQDSAQRLHALQLELTAVQLLRQQLEDGVKANEELRDDLERELDRAKVREGVRVVDPKELESVQHQLEDAQRWNASLQARFGAIQNRGGGVGGANDCGDSLSFAGDQTSYMSICAGEGHDDRSHQELRQKVLELQDCVNKLQAQNKEEKTAASARPWKQQTDTATITEVPPGDDRMRQSQDQATQTDVPPGQSPVDESVDSGLGQSRELVQCAGPETNSVNCLLSDSGATTPLQLREEVLRLTAENVQLRGLLKEQKSNECKEKESTDASGNSSDGQAELRRSRETLLRVQAKNNEDEGPKVTTDGLGTLQDGGQSKIGKDRASLRSRLPVPVRPRAEAYSDAHLDPCKADTAQCPHTDSDQKSSVDSTVSSQPRAGPSPSRSSAPDSSCPATRTPADTQAHDALFAQLELLHQECQEKEALIKKQLADWEELHAQLQDKEHLNRQYVAALRAAESTISYLTACSLDSQTGSGPQEGSASMGCNSTQLDLHKVLQEKEALNKQLIQLLNLAEKHMSSKDSQETWAEFADLRLKIEAVNASSKEQGSSDVFGGLEGLEHSDSLEGTARQSDSIETASESLTEKESKDQRDTRESSNISNQEMTKVLAKRLSLIESVISSLAAACTNTSTFTSPELEEHLDKLQRTVENSQELDHLTQATQSSIHSEKLLNSELHHHLRLLCKVLADRSQRICELQASLQEERSRREESETRATLSNGKGLAPNVQAQLETLHKALREKKKACENLEEKLATAQSAPSTNNTAGRAVEQDDKSVQVDLQDLGYETTGKSENDRAESSSTEVEMGVKATGSTSSLPLLLTPEQAHLSSPEHVDSTSSTPYPSSPTLSSAKVSLKSLQTYEEYGLSEDPLQLQAQVRELKTQLESQTKLVSQMQSLLQRNAINLAGGHRSDRSTSRDGTQDHHARHSREPMREKDGEGKDRSVRSEASESEAKKATKEQLQHARSRSASPASLDSLVQSQARELSQLRQQIKESRRLGGVQRRQMGELRRAFQELLRASPADCYLGEVVKGQLDKTLSILDRLEGRLDKVGETHQDNEDVAALERSNWLAKELQEKNRLIQSLQSQVRGQSPGSPHSAHSDVDPPDRASSSSRGSPPVQGGATDSAAASGRLLGLERENGLLHERLSSSEQLNASLRRELELHLSVMAHHRDGRDAGGASAAKASAEVRPVDSDLLAEHLEEIRALRRRLEESICTNDRLREQLERRLAELEKDAATNIFVHGNEDQAQLVKEVRFLWVQNQGLKEQLHQESKDKRLRDDLARRAARLEQSRKENDVLRQENAGLRERLDLGGRENARLLRSLRASEDQLRGLQCEVKLQRQQVTDSQRLLQSLRVELQVHEKMETATHAQDPGRPPPGATELSELLSEMRHLRLQLERSIRTNDTLRHRLEEQLWGGAGHSETININYVLSAAADGASGPPAREGADVYGHQVRREAGGGGGGGGSGSSSGESTTGAPSRLVPGHRLWANRNGRHILALVEDYGALRRHISEGRKLLRGVDVRLHQCLTSKATDDESVKLLRGDVGTVQRVLDEAARLLKLAWRVSLPAGGAGPAGNNQQDDLKKEISRLKSRLTQQERMLSGAVKRLRTTNQLKEGMERVIVDQLSLTHGVLKKARGNLEKNHCYLFGPQGQGGACKWPIGGVDVYTSDEQ